MSYNNDSATTCIIDVCYMSIVSNILVVGETEMESNVNTRVQIRLSTFLT